MDEADNVSDDSQTKMTMTTKTPLSAIAHAFEELSEFLECQVKDEELRLDTFCDACSLVSVLFSSLGLAFRFAEMEYVVKIGDLVEASKRFATLENVLDLDVANGTVKKPGSHSRICVVLDRDAASTAYAQVCVPYHTWAVRAAVSAGMYTLPTREQLLLKLNETDHTAEKKMSRYIKASRPVIDYIDKLYISRNITLD